MEPKNRGRVFVEVTDLKAISSDNYQWMLMKRNKKEAGGYSSWIAYSYHPEFGSAAASLEKEFILTCGAQTFTELSRMAKKIHEYLAETFKLAESYKSGED